jgi:hypothetical protein
VHTNQLTAAFYVRVEDIDDDDLVQVSTTAALPGFGVDQVDVRTGDYVFVIDIDDNIASAVVVDQTAFTLLLQVHSEWSPMSLADIEVRAWTAAVRAVEKQSRPEAP